ncbi:SHQ1 protein-domain-containing protein [Melanogaster broomeanus]|nr:SHQ1 protein-domain-containing protein [Melanogaster broomeanus]
MITPKFSCSQTDDTVIASLYCPSVRASDAEINVDDTLLTVHINPYFLRLNLPHAVVEDEDSSARYDPSTGYLTITLTKEVKGQHFADLDLLAKLLAPRPSQPPPPPSIEVLETQNTDTGEDDVNKLSEQTNQLTLEEEDEFLKAAESDWQLPQTVPEASAEFHTSSKRYYGFLDMYTGFFVHVAHTENDVNELGNDAESCTIDDRRKLRIAHENEKWDEEHYMADYADDEYIQELVNWEDPGQKNTSDLVYTEQESMEMLRLPRKEYIMDKVQERNLYLTLITLLFAHAYDKRTTLHDPTPESAWTICTLVPVFSALDPPPYTYMVPDVVRHPELIFSDGELLSALTTSYRRSFAFPLYRSFRLAEECRKDVSAAMMRGKRMIARCLLEMKRILDHHEVYYVYSKIWLDDFSVWIQTSASDDVLQEVAKKLATLPIPKYAIGWDLEKLEEATELVSCREESDSDDDSIE